MSLEAILLLLALVLLLVLLAVVLLRDPAQRITSLMLDQTRALGGALASQTDRVTQSAAQIQERLAVMDTARENIEALSGQVHTLAGILGNKQARGAFGEMQLEVLVRDRLPDGAFSLQHSFSNGRRADCLIRLPHPPGPIVVDSKFPLESWRALQAAADGPARAEAAKRFAADCGKHIKDVAERYIIPGETADGALIFVPSEAIFAELHGAHPAVVAEAARRNVYVVSPSTLWAVLGTMRALLRDVRIRAEAGRIKEETARLVQEVRRLEERVKKLKTHFAQAQDDMREIEITTEKLVRAGARIDAVEIEDRAA